MIKGLYASSQNMHAKVKNMEVVANNLANINTTGYKRQLAFSEIMDRFADKDVKQLTDFSDGSFLNTGNPLDFALSGDAFFAIKSKDGIEYSRNGKFQISEEGYLVNEQGNKVLGKNGEIDLAELKFNKEASLNVSKSGEVRIGEMVIDELLIVKNDETKNLARKDGGNFISLNGTLIAANEEEYSVNQGFIEEANVNPMLEMQQMITVNKEFESAQKIISSIDQSLERGNEIGKV